MIRTAARILAGGMVVGCGCFAWGLAEARIFTVRRFELPLLPVGSAPVKVLHLSDIHLMSRQTHKLRFLETLADLEPDLIVNTGDNMSDPDALDPLMNAMGDLRDVPGVFVFGSNDYRSPSFGHPILYLVRSTTRDEKASRPRDMPWQKLRDRFASVGWVDLTHEHATLDIAGNRLAFRGTDDAHLCLDDYSLVAGPSDATADLNIGVTHAPYLRLLDAMTADGLDLILAGHTHGGQVCIPFKGAIVTNCDLDTSRAKGLSTHTFGGHRAALVVSAGLGSSPFAPYRFACRPEATLLTLTARPA